MDQGYDLSAHNSVEDVKLALSGDFIGAKCTEGNGVESDLCVDPAYKNIRTAVRGLKGKRFFGYLFAHPENNPIAEADWFIAHAGLQPGECAAVDFEPYAARYKGTDESKWAPWILAVLDRLHEKLLCRPLLYLNDDMAKRVFALAAPDVAARIRQYPLWKALPGTDPGQTYGFQMVMWQHEWNPVDKDQYMGTEEDWQAICIPQPGWETKMKSVADLVQLGKDLVATDPSQVWATEGPAPFGPVHNALHASWSEHALGEAIDFNYGHGSIAAGDLYPPEVHWVETVALPLAVSRGFAVRWYMGPGDHRNHLHVDCNRYGLSGVYGHDNVPTAQVEGLLKQIGQWHPDSNVYRTEAQIKAIQISCGAPRDGIYGPKTKAAVKELQARLVFAGFKLMLDGEWGPTTDAAYRSFCSGKLDPRTIRVWQHNAGTVVDGKISKPSQLIKKVQQDDSKASSVQPKYKLTGKEIDGILGPNTWKMIQDLMGIHVTGKSDRFTLASLQRRLLRGSY